MQTRNYPKEFPSRQILVAFMTTPSHNLVGQSFDWSSLIGQGSDEGRCGGEKALAEQETAQKGAQEIACGQKTPKEQTR